MSFEQEMAAFREKTLKKVVKVKKMSAFELFGDIIYSTPVLDGYLRNNWFVTIGSGTTQTIDSPDKNGSGTIRRMEQTLNYTTLQADTYFTNNLPYAYPIEFDGHSAKAPEGMVRVNALNWDRIVARNAKKIADEENP